MESKFDSIPQKVLEKILDYFDLADRQKYRLISKFWSSTVTSLYGVTLVVHNLNLESSISCKASPILAYFQSLTLPLPMNETGTDFLNRLTSLSLTGVIVCYNIFPVFQKCQQLRKLELIECIVNQHVNEYELNLDDPSQLLPALRALNIRLRFHPFQSAEFHFFKRLIPFFTSESGKLESIVLDSSFISGGALRTMFDHIFQKNSICTTLKNVSDPFNPQWVYEGRIADEFYTGLFGTNIKTLQNLEIGDVYFGCIFKLKLLRECDVADLSAVQFLEFEHMLYCYELRDEFYSNADNYISLANLLDPQTHLTKLTVTVSRTLIMNQVYGIANRNAGTLKSLTIYDSNYQQVRLDGFYLSQLNVLQHLKYSVLPSTRSSIHNFHYLPTSLRTISTTIIIIFENESEFNQANFQRLHKLETLELLAMAIMPIFLFGQQLIYEMDSLKIRKLIAWLPSLKKLVVRNSLRQADIIPMQPHVSNSLPDAATDWINNEPEISFEKVPIVTAPEFRKENPALIGRYVGWESNFLPNNHQLEYPLHFDGVILIQPGFQRNTLVL